MSSPYPEPTPEQLADEYAAARRRIRDLLLGAGDTAPDAEEVASVGVPACPAWTVADLCAHLAGVAADLVARRNPGPDVQAWVDGQVAERKGRSLRELVDEWDTVSPAFEDSIRRHPLAFSSLTYDAVVHEHDLRGALGRPGARSSSGVAASLSIATQTLTRDLGAHGLGAVRLASPEHVWTAGTGTVELSIETSAFELLRLTGSRRSAAQLRAAPWEGDVERYLPALAHMPLPVRDIEEPDIQVSGIGQVPGIGE